MVAPAQQNEWHQWIESFHLQREHIVSADDFQMVDAACTSFESRQLNQAQRLFSRALAWAEHTRTPDARQVQAFALVGLADIERIQGDGNQAGERYKQATELFQVLSRHNFGVACHRFATWLEEREQLPEAWSEYSRTLRFWRELASEHGRQGNLKRYDRYREQIDLLEKQIAEISTRSVAQTDTADHVQPAPPPPDSERAARWGERVWVEEGFRELPVLDVQIAGGEPLWIEEESQIDVARVGTVVLMGDAQYVAHSLIDASSYLNLLPHYRHAIARVRGTSMNRATPVAIEDGDWIVVRSPLEAKYEPMNGHIVVVELLSDVDRRVMVKRFYRVGMTIRLESETASPDLPAHQPREFTITRGDDPPPLQFIGQTIAVFKPARANGKNEIKL